MKFTYVISADIHDVWFLYTLKCFNMFLSQVSMSTYTVIMFFSIHSVIKVLQYTDSEQNGVEMKCQTFCRQHLQIHLYELKCLSFNKQGKSEGFDSCDWPSNPTQIGFKSLIFQPV